MFKTVDEFLLCRLYVRIWSLVADEITYHCGIILYLLITEFGFTLLLNDYHNYYWMQITRNKKYTLEEEWPWSFEIIHNDDNKSVLNVELTD